MNKPYKICDAKRTVRKGLTASNLDNLKDQIRQKLDIDNDEEITVCLEFDGTEIDDEEYFSLLDPNTKFMVLRKTEKWCPETPACHISLDETDSDSKEGRAAQLVGRIQQNLCHISLLSGQDLELLSDMDPESMTDLLTEKDNKYFLEQIKEASGRVLYEKQQASEAMELLKLYHNSVANGNEDLNSKRA